MTIRELEKELLNSNDVIKYTSTFIKKKIIILFEVSNNNLPH